MRGLHHRRAGTALGLLLVCSGPVLGTLGCNGSEPENPDLKLPDAILIIPNQAVVPLGEDVQLTATGVYDDRTSLDITNLVIWTSLDPSVIRASQGLDEEGLITGLRVGQGQVEATLNGVISPPIDVTVTDAGLVGLTVEPNSLDLAVGDTVQLEAIAAYSDGARADSSSQVRWKTDDGSVAQIATGGVLTAAGSGSTNIWAEWDDIQSTKVPVTVSTNASADLKIKEVEGEAGSDEITLTVTIKNSGDKGASNFFVDVWLDPSPNPQAGDLGDFYELISYAGANEEIDVSFSIPADPGTHKVWVWVDVDELIDEPNDTNNKWSGDITVGGSTTSSGPNLYVSYFDYISDSTSVYYAIDVTNGGGEDVGEFYVDVYIDQGNFPVIFTDGDDYTLVDSLGAGETTYADFLIDTWCYYCTSWALIDSYDYVEETDENDNYDGPLYVYSDY